MKRKENKRKENKIRINIISQPMMTLVKTLINASLLMMVIVLFFNIFLAIEYILNAMLLPDLVHLIWFILWIPAVCSGTMLLSQVLLT